MSGFEPKDAPEEDQLLNCMRCGMCLPTCPTFQLTGRERSSPRGRIALMKAVHDGALDIDNPTFAQEMNDCLGCLACVSACPAGVEYGGLLEAARDQLQRRREKKLPWLMQRAEDLVFQLFEKPALLRFFGKALMLYQRLGLESLVNKSGILHRLPSPIAELHDMLWALPLRFSSQELGAELEPVGPERHRVGLIFGCVMDVMFSPENLATARVLQRNGCRVMVPPSQGCCGALHAHSGRLEGARELARKLIDCFEAARVEYVVINSAGCGNCLKDYAHLLHDDPAYAQRASWFQARVKDIHEVLGLIGYQPPTRPLTRSVTYHDACHLAHGQGVREAPRNLCRTLTEDYRELPSADRCCGSAGTYNVTHFDTSMELLDKKIDDILSTGAEVVGVANPGCLLQIRYGLKRRGSNVRAEHPVVLLEEAYRQGS